MSDVTSRAIRLRLGGLAGFDLAWRVPSLTPSDGTGFDLALAVLSLAIGVEAPPLLEEVTTWILIAYVGAVVSPSLYPGKLGVPAEKRSFRILLGSLIVCNAIAIRQLIETTPLIASVGGVVLLGITGMTLLLYLRAGHGWILSPEDERFLTLLDEFFPSESVRSEVREDFSRPGLLGIVGARAAQAAAAVLLAIPVTLGGVVTMSLLNLYPLPDVLVVIWITLWTISSITGYQYRFSRDTIDLESRLYDIVKESTKSLKGLTLGLYLVLITFTFALLFAAGVGVGTTALLSIPGDTTPSYTLLWGGVGGIFIPFAVSCYGLWCCLRMATRLPIHLRRQTAVGPDVESDLSDYDSERQDPVPRRPIGFVVPPAVILLSAVVTAAVAGLGSVIFGVIWPLSVLGLLGCVMITRRFGATTVSRDDAHIIAGLVVVLLMIGLLGNVEAVVSTVTAGELHHDEIPPTIYAAAIIVWLGYLADVVQYAQSHTDARRFFKSLYFLAFALVFGILSQFTSGPYIAAFYVVLTIALLGGIALFLTAWFRI